MAETAITGAELRLALGHFATGVTIITARDPQGLAVGLTASSFNSVSLDPPLVLWSLGARAASLPTFLAASHYAIHVLQADQRALAERFSSRMADRFAGLNVGDGLGAAPLLEGAAAVLECHNLRRHTEGDHVVFVGEVKRIQTQAQAQPLLYHGGRFYTELPMGAALASSQTTEDGAEFVDDYLGYLLGQANHAVYKDFDHDLREAGVSHIEWRVLAVLNTKKALSVTELSHAVLSKQPTVTKLVQRMVALGWLQIADDGKDQRKSVVSATRAGLKLGRTLVAHARTREAVQLGHLAAHERDLLKALLRKIKT